VAIRNSSLLNRGMASAILLLASLPYASARDRGFNAVVRAVEATYHVKRNYRFLTRFVGVAARVARPEGVKHLRMAIFEDQDFSPPSDETEFERAIANALAVGWRPIVRVRSKRDGERTHIYAREAGKDISLFIVTVEEREAVVMEVKMSPEKFAEMLDEPASISGSLRDSREEKDVRAESEVTAAEPPKLQRRDSSVPENP
jgi:hypothetical protein